MCIVSQRVLKRLSLVLCLTVAISPGSAFATKGGPVIPVQMSVNKANVKPGESFTYRITATNGNTNATRVMLQMDLPQQVSCSAFTGGVACALKPGNIFACNPGTLAKYQAIDITLTCKVNTTVTCGSTITSLVGLWANREDARATTVQKVQCVTPTPTPTKTKTPVPTVAPTKTPYPTATRTSVPTPVKTPVRKAECSDGIDNDLDGDVDYPEDDGCANPQDDNEDTQLIKVIKSAPASIKPGELIKYTIKVTNLGPKNITGVTAEDFNINNNTEEPINHLFKFEKAENATCSQEAGEKPVTCDLGNLKSKESKEFYLYFRVPAGKGQCNLDVMNQVDVYESTDDSNYINWAKAVTRVRCDDGESCEHHGAYYFTNGYDLLSAKNTPGDRAQQQAYSVVTRYELTTDGNFRSNWAADRGYGGVFWYRSNFFLRTLTPANRSWMYLDPKTGIIRLWDPNNTRTPEQDIFIAQLGGGRDACGVCCGNASSCHPAD